MLKTTWLATSSSVVLSSPKADDAHGRNDGDGAGDQPAQPRAKAEVQKALHDDLSGESAGESGVLTGSEQRHGKQDARSADAEQRAEQLVGVFDFGDSWCPDQWNADAERMRMEALMKSANMSATVESMVANLMASRFPSGVCSKSRVCTMMNAGRDYAASP